MRLLVTNLCNIQIQRKFYQPIKFRQRRLGNLFFSCDSSHIHDNEDVDGVDDFDDVDDNENI